MEAAQYSYEILEKVKTDAMQETEGSSFDASRDLRGEGVDNDARKRRGLQSLSRRSSRLFCRLLSPTLECRSGH